MKLSTVCAVLTGAAITVNPVGALVFGGFTVFNLVFEHYSDPNKIAKDYLKDNPQVVEFLMKNYPKSK